MLWRDPLYLWLLVVVLGVGVLLVALLRRRAAALAAFADAALVERLTPGLDPRRPLWRTGLRVAALALIVIALAGPKRGFQWQQVKREGIDLIVALDTSRSMLATDVKPDRLERAKLAILDLLPLLQGDRIGLVAFAGTAFLECPLTVDYAAFERSLRGVEVGTIPRGGTALARAIETSLEGFEARQGKYEALILITDGEDHEGDVKAAVKQAAEQGVKIFTIGIGTPDGELIPDGSGGFVKDRRGQVVKSRLDPEPLKQIALDTGGAYAQGLGPSLGLDQVFSEHIAKMERREVASALQRRYEDRFQIPLAIAIALLVIEWLIPLRRGPVRRAGWRRAAHTATIALFLPVLFGFLDPQGDRAAEGNQLYANGKYDEAASKYGEGLLDAPGSPVLQFNLATALYKQGKYDDALATLTKLAASGDSAWVAKATYNMGNVHYRLGVESEGDAPEQAIENWQLALTDYKRAMVADPKDGDAKFNHEFVTRRIAELQKKLAEEKEKKKQEEEDKPQEQQDQQDQQQEQGEQNQQQQEPGEQDEQQQDQQQGEQQQDQPDSGEEQQPEQQPGEQQDQQQAGGEPEQQQPQPQPGEEQQQQAGEQQQQADEQQQQDAAAHQPQQMQGDAADEPAKPAGGGGTTVDGETSDSPEQQAAQAVLDTARGEELDPQDIKRPVTGAGVGEAGQDW